jgi:hypothetical protein
MKLGLFGILISIMEDLRSPPQVARCWEGASAGLNPLPQVHMY